MVKSGDIVLCPPLRDLRRMVDCEIKDWDFRRREYLQSGKIPDRTAPRDLSGLLSYIWQATNHHEKGRPTGTVSYIAPSLRPEERNVMQPVSDLKQVLVFETRADQHLAVELPSTDEDEIERRIFELNLQFNPPNKPWRVNPYAVIVRAMENLHGPYAPDAIFFCTYAEPDKIVPMKNPIEEYEALLLQLRDLYSRTNEDLLRECGYKPSIGPPLCNNGDVQATRQGAKNSGHVNRRNMNWLTPKQMKAAQKELRQLLIKYRDLEPVCILCGSADDVRAHRMAISYENGRHDDLAQSHTAGASGLPRTL
ncbi:hypothetical protein C8Q70DRAFT_94075 [Cubamyces menziesii]|nr:hypothetical protein C8Q70DRAFT_94075 [Cubamyces menziesii]